MVGHLRDLPRTVVIGHLCDGVSEDFARQIYDNHLSELALPSAVE